MEVGNGRFAADAAQFGAAMNSIAHSQAMVAAIKDYTKEMEGSAQQQQAAGPGLDVNDLLDDAELQKLHEERVAQLKAEHEKRAAMQRAGHGELQEVSEGDFLEVVTKTEHVVAHFCHRDFERCKIMDKHLTKLAAAHFKTRFIKISAPDSPFFTVKLGIKMLPCVVMFKHGVAVDRVVGLDGLGGLDDFKTSALEDRLYEAEVIEDAAPNPSREDEQLDAPKGNLRRGFHQQQQQRTASDEDSDFD